MHECAYSVYIYIYLSTHTCMYIMYMYVHYYLLAPSFFVIPSFLSLLSCSILSPYLPSSLLPYTDTHVYNSIPSLFSFKWTCTCHVDDLVSAVRELVTVATSTVTPFLKNNTFTRLYKETKEVATATTILCSLAETLQGNKFSVYHIHVSVIYILYFVL